LSKKDKKKGLIIIAPESQGHSPATINKFVKKHHIPYTIVRGSNGPSNPRGLPYSIVFDSTGTAIFEGRPSDPAYKRSIKKALKELASHGGISRIPTNPSKSKSSATPKKTDLIPLRTWTNLEGKKIKAAVTKISSSTVIFEFITGKKVRYNIEKLSEADQALIRKVKAKQSSTPS